MIHFRLRVARLAVAFDGDVTVEAPDVVGFGAVLLCLDVDVAGGLFAADFGGLLVGIGVVVVAVAAADAVLFVPADEVGFGVVDSGTVALSLSVDFVTDVNSLAFFADALDAAAAFRAGNGKLSSLSVEESTEIGSVENRLRPFDESA